MGPSPTWPYGKGRPGHRPTDDNHVKTQGEDGRPSPERPRRSQPCQHLDLEPCSPQNFEKMNVCLAGLGWSTGLRLLSPDAIWSTPLLWRHGPVAPAGVNRPGSVLPGFSLSFFPRTPAAESPQEGVGPASSGKFQWPFPLSVFGWSHRGELGWVRSWLISLRPTPSAPVPHGLTPSPIPVPECEPICPPPSC